MNAQSSISSKYSAFTFCDRITDLVPARSARAVFLVPARLDEFAACLVAEAVGQLAAWVSMAHIGFRGRPVAALAGATHFLGAVKPGQTLELEVDIDSCDDETVAYAGRASVGGQMILQLADCVGPMLPQAEFDSPEDLAQQFELLCGAGAVPGRFTGFDRPPLSPLQQEADHQRMSRLDVPADAIYFRDHFPRRPVFPATLLLDSAIRVAGELMATQFQAGVDWMPVRMSNVKMRDFVLPGQSVQIGTELLKSTTGLARIALSATVGERTVATARIEYAAAGAAP